ncbi:MAG: PD-(D/E)XK nuclease family protein [Opitutaceae bacterium]|nr:PD-(D/E)XK nuclease family protein [Opitutaceae bacterium]
MPDSLRSTLGLPCNDTRLARDWLLLRSILAARAPENVRLLLARVNTRADALKPSRLLFTGTGDGDAADKLFAARAARLFKDAAPPAPAPPRSLPAAWRLALPLPGDGPAAGFFAARPEKSRHGLPAVSVTALKDYIACPFAFFLKHVLQMETVDYRAAELDESAFGRLAHEVLEAFAQSPAARSGDAGEISRFLHEKTDALFAKNFGAELAAVLLLQREELKKRLGFFARQQAAAAAAGWEIIAAERHFTLPFPAHGFEIHGKIDRVDRNQNTGCFRILDYKTWDKKKDAGEGVYDPGKTALDNAAGRRCPRLVVPPATPKGRPKSAAWADLQLPLYLRAAQTGAVRKAPDSDDGTGTTGSTGDDSARLVPEGADIACAHFALGRSEEVSGLSDYDQRLFRDPSIDGTLDALLSRLAAGIFWPPLKRKYPPLEPFKPLFLGLSEEEIAASISEPWIADQNRRIANWDAARAARQEEPA